jgi:hypothetical protein
MQGAGILHARCRHPACKVPASCMQGPGILHARSRHPACKVPASCMQGPGIPACISLPFTKVQVYIFLYSRVFCLLLDARNSCRPFQSNGSFPTACRHSCHAPNKTRAELDTDGRHGRDHMRAGLLSQAPVRNSEMSSMAQSTASVVQLRGHASEIDHATDSQNAVKVDIQGRRFSRIVKVRSRTLRSQSPPFRTLRSQSPPFRTLRSQSPSFRTLRSQSPPFRTLRSQSPSFRTLRSQSPPCGFHYVLARNVSLHIYPQTWVRSYYECIFPCLHVTVPRVITK